MVSTLVIIALCAREWIRIPLQSLIWHLDENHEILYWSLVDPCTCDYAGRVGLKYVTSGVNLQQLATHTLSRHCLMNLTLLIGKNLSSGAGPSLFYPVLIQRITWVKWCATSLNPKQAQDSAHIVVN